VAAAVYTTASMEKEKKSMADFHRVCRLYSLSEQKPNSYMYVYNVTSIEVVSWVLIESEEVAREGRA
jgi:hypothetical protein